jgi:hypothetical protein
MMPQLHRPAHLGLPSVGSRVLPDQQEVLSLLQSPPPPPQSSELES